MDKDCSTFRFNDEFWAQMVDKSRYVMAHRAERVMFSSIDA